MAIATISTGISACVPSTCDPSSVSSTYTRLVAPTSATSTSGPAACSTGQVVVNPSFNGYPPSFEPDLSPWVISHDSGATGCAYNPSSFAEAATDQYFGDPRSIKCAFPASGGQDHISQDLHNLCRYVEYTLTFQVACDYLTYGGGDAQAATSIAAFFDNQTLVPKHLCPICDPSVEPCNSPIYTTFSSILFGPASGNGTLKFEVTQDAVDQPSYPLLLDIIYLEGKGYDGLPYNPPLA